MVRICKKLGGDNGRTKTSNSDDYRKRLDSALMEAVRVAASISMENPTVAGESVKMLWYQKKAARIRRRWAKRGYAIPPYAILSVTHACNLSCKGCFDRVLHPRRGDELSDAAWERVIREASIMGVSVFVIIGGEPFCRSNLLSITAEFPDCLFLVFTNGTLLDENKIRMLKKQKNVIPILSVEGYTDDTDKRRGSGVYDKISETAGSLHKNRILFGASITLSEDNYSCVSNDDFINDLYDTGSRIFFLVEYLPAQPRTEHKALTDEHKKELLGTTSRLRKKFRAIFLDFPGDEYVFGGCLSAGRGFIHISAEGNVEPCPFSPYSDANVRECSLAQALDSPLFRAIRSREERPEETKGNCALWVERAWVSSLAKN